MCVSHTFSHINGGAKATLSEPISWSAGGLSSASCSRLPASRRKVDPGVFPGFRCERFGPPDQAWRSVGRIHSGSCPSFAMASPWDVPEYVHRGLPLDAAGARSERCHALLGAFPVVSPPDPSPTGQCVAVSASTHGLRLGSSGPGGAFAGVATPCMPGRWVWLPVTAVTRLYLRAGGGSTLALGNEWGGSNEPPQGLAFLWF